MASRIDGGLRVLFRDNLPTFHWQSVETGGTGLGVPDSNYCRLGAEGWIEFKATQGWTVTLRPAQVGWIDQRCRAGGRVWIAVRRTVASGARRDAADQLWLIAGCHARLAKTGGLKVLLEEDAVTGVWDGGPRRWDWDEIHGHLIR